MRHPSLLALTIIIACSSAESGVVTPPPPPPGGTVPAVLVVQAGDGQHAEPGAALTVKPVVAVKDAAGLGVAGVTVTFAVDSGGGSLQSTTATTAANGTASPGDWHLGTVEGRNVMSAHAASLTTIKLVATAVVGTVTLATQTVGSGGKTISITTGALAGTSLVIPAGAFMQNATWTLEQRSNADWPRRAGVNPVGAALHITSGDTGRAAQAMMLTLPAVVPAGTKPFVLMRSLATNAIEVLQTVSVDSGTITVAVQHFDASWITPARQGLTGLKASTRSGAPPTLSYDAEVMVSAIPEADLERDVDTGFRPETDAWDFLYATTSFTSTIGPAGSMGVGIAISQMAYYAYLKPQYGSLNKKYRQIASDSASNRVGYHASAYTGWVAPENVIGASLTSIHNSARASLADQQFYDLLKANLLVSGLPQLVYAERGTFYYPLMAYRVAGGNIEMINPYVPGQPTAVQFAGGRFAPYSVAVGSTGATALVDWLGTTPIGQWLKMPQLAQDITTIASGIGQPDRDYWPAATVHARGGFVEDTIMYIVDDTTRFWVECPTCGTGIPSLLPPGRVEPFVARAPQNDGSSLIFSGPGADGKLITQVTSTGTRLGFTVLEASASDAPAKWLDFQWIRAKKWVLTLPPGQIAEPGVPTAFSITIDGPTPLPDHRFVWTFGTGAGATTVASTALTVTTTLTQLGTQPVTIEMRRTSDDKVIAISHSTVKVDVPIYTAWKITAMTMAVVNDTRLANGGDTYQNFVASQGGTQGLADVWTIFRNDSTHWYAIAAGTEPGAIVLTARDTLLPSPPHAPGAGFLRSIYWWSFQGQGSAIPTSASVPLDGGIIGSSNALNRGGTSCHPLLSARFVQSGSLTSGSVSGLNWVRTYVQDAVPEPLITSEFQVTMNGDVMTGTYTQRYRLDRNCTTESQETAWSYQASFTATRVR